MITQPIFSNGDSVRLPLVDEYPGLRGRVFGGIVIDGRACSFVLLDTGTDFKDMIAVCRLNTQLQRIEEADGEQ